MMEDISKEFREICQRRTPQIDMDLDPVWEEELELVTEDYDATLWFIRNTMDGMDLANLSEAFENIFAAFYSEELVDAIRDAMQRFPLETERWYVEDALDWALGSAERHHFPKPELRLELDIVGYFLEAEKYGRPI